MPSNKKTRNTLRKQIIEAAKQGDWFSSERARYIAQSGKKLTPIESLVFTFYRGCWEQRMKTNAKFNAASKDVFGSAWDEEIDAFVDNISALLCQVFLAAVKSHDRDRIIEIADAVWYFKDKIVLDPAGAKHDPIRDAILKLRYLVKTTKSPMNIATAVSFVEAITGKKIPGKENGYKDFRDKCKELDFPIEPTRKPSRKIRVK